uniref:Transposase MuDR plant domain-containing protein n=1 Tax=Lactuca sativa TaxID=4236 RepID=A0A9R1XRH5_LACSA|nr:hypothetical protein LSAT_V11C100037040 [Lactuca sativa]
MEVVTMLCYWGGTTCDGPDGINYSKAPKKAINVNRRIQFDELIDCIYLATSFDKQHHRINLICRYPSVGIGNIVKYIPLPIKDNDDVGIMFDVLRVHQEVSNIDLYLEEPPHVDRGETSFDNNHQVPSTFTSIEETNVISDGNWTVSQSISKNDFTRELEKDSFKDKEELMRAIKLQCINTHRQFEVIETRPTLWSIRCKLHLQSGCKWQLRANHTNLDASLIAQETKHLIKEQPSIGVPALRAEISYAALPKNFGALQKFNPGTIVEWCVSRSTDAEQVEFRRVFWAFVPCIKGFAHCRPVISIDGTHLYEHEGICLISDRHLGILKVVNEHGSPWLERRGFHRYCLRHFINNFNDKFRNSELKALAYRAGSQNQVRKFNSIMEEIGKLNPQARQWLEKHPLDRWTLAHDRGRRYGLLTTNLSEIFNSVLKEYCSTWASEFSPLPHEAYWPQSSSRQLLPNLELLRNKKGRPRSTRLQNGMDIKEGKNGYLCGICRQSGHNRKKCPSKPR